MDVNATANFLERGGGARIKLRRQTGKGLYIEVTCVARITKFTLEMRAQIAAAGGVAQGDRLVVISNREITEKRWPGPPRRGDIVIIEGEGNTTFVQGCDTATLENVVMRHDLTIRGGN